MEELIKLVSAKTGLNPQMAKEAVNVIVTHLKSKLPPALAGQVDSLLAGKDLDLKNVGDLLGGILGKKS